MIVGVAGHIDHGKTSLVRALTGVETDRLPEEKARGISIDIGFAYKRLADGTSLAFVDMPGHEKFIRNMVAGACGIDLAVVVVAANEGVKPQTLEHLLALDMLGVRRGVAVLTKSDLATAERIVSLSIEVGALLDRHGMHTAPAVPVSVRDGRGLDALSDLLATEATQHRRPLNGQRFRLAIDRFFLLDGHGPVITGTVWAGEARVGDRLVIAPSGITARVRRIHADGEPAEVARAGQRCALNVAGPGITDETAARGNWVVDPVLDRPTTELDARLRLAASARRPLMHWSQMQLHLGAGSAEARVALLEGDRLEPGAQALARLVTTEKVLALHGDRFLLRDPATRRVVGGGTVLDPFAPPARRRKAERVTILRALEEDTPADRLAGLLRAVPGGVDLQWFALIHNLAETPAASPSWVVVPDATPWGFDRGHLETLHRKAVEAVAAFLTADATRKGMPDERLRRHLGLGAQGFEALLGGLVREQKLVREDGSLSLPGHSPDLTQADRMIVGHLVAMQVVAPFTPIPLATLPTTLRLRDKEVADAIKRLSRLGRLVFIERDLVILSDALATLATLTEATAARADGSLTLAAFRAVSGVGRNHAVALLDYFDRRGFTRRSGDSRKMVRTAALAFRQTAAQESA